jgi:TRAP-type mannitol/chloroaromatic compound transport system permease small subunit
VNSPRKPRRRSPLGTLEAVAQWIGLRLGQVAGLLIVVIMLNVVADVTARYLLRISFAWAFELNLYLMIAAALLGSVYTTAVEGHVRVDLVHERLPPRLRWVTDLGACVVAIIVCALLVWYGGQSAWESLREGEISTQVMQWPLFPSRAVIPVAGFFIGFLMAVRLARLVAEGSGGAKR